MLRSRLFPAKWPTATWVCCAREGRAGHAMSLFNPCMPGMVTRLHVHGAAAPRVRGPARARMPDLAGILAARGSLPAWAVLAVEAGRLAREAVLPHPSCPIAPAPIGPQLPALECPAPYCPEPRCPTCPRCPSPPRLEAAAWSAAGAGGVQCVAWAAWKVVGCCRYARAAGRVAPARRGAGVLA